MLVGRAGHKLEAPFGTLRASGGDSPESRTVLPPVRPLSGRTHRHAEHAKLMRKKYAPGMINGIAVPNYGVSRAADVPASPTICGESDLARTHTCLPAPARAVHRASRLLVI